MVMNLEILDGFVNKYLLRFDNIYLVGSFQIKRNFDSNSDIDIVVLGNKITRAFHQYIKYEGVNFDVVYLPKQSFIKVIEFDKLFSRESYSNMLRNATVIKDKDNSLRVIQELIKNLDLERLEQDCTDKIIQVCFNVRELIIDLEREPDILESTLIINSILDHVISLDLLLNGGVPMAVGKWKARSLRECNEELYNTLHLLLNKSDVNNSEFIKFVKDYLNKIDIKYTLENSSSRNGLKDTTADLNSFFLTEQELSILFKIPGFFEENFFIDILKDGKLGEVANILYLKGSYQELIGTYPLANKVVYKKKLTYFNGGRDLEEHLFSSMPSILFILFHELNILMIDIDDRFDHSINILSRLNLKRKNELFSILANTSLHYTVNGFNLLNEQNYEEIKSKILNRAEEFLDSFEPSSNDNVFCDKICSQINIIISSIRGKDNFSITTYVKLIDYFVDFMMFSREQRYLLYKFLYYKECVNGKKLI